MIKVHITWTQDSEIEEAINVIGAVREGLRVKNFYAGYDWLDGETRTSRMGLKNLKSEVEGMQP